MLDSLIREVAILVRIVARISGPPLPVLTDGWKVPYLGKLLEERDMLLYQGLADTHEEVESVQSLIDSLCTN